MEYFHSVREAEDWIFGLRYSSVKDGLNNMKALCGALGHPEDELRFVHVAGTDGKGSVCAMLERMLRENGYKTGLYTSPHLMRFSERMRIGGEPVADGALIRAVSRVREAAEALVQRDIRPNFFELCTAAAFLVFLDARVDIVVLETGMGGRLDATNVVMPEACLITSIGMDHTKQLGDTLEAIAGEKAGIVKKGVPFAAAEQTDGVRAVFAAAAREKEAPFTDLGSMPWSTIREGRYGSAFEAEGKTCRLSLPGRHQIQNGRLALAGAKLLTEAGWRLDMDVCVKALDHVTWPARLEWLDERTLMDGAHNPHGAQALADYVRSQLSGERVVALLGMMKDKAVSDCAGIFAGAFDAAVATQIDYPRALPCGELADTLKNAGLPTESERDMARALERARELADGGVTLICGSLYLCGDMRRILKDDGGRI